MEDELTEEQKAAWSEAMTRALSMQTAAMSLLDGAICVKQGKMKSDDFANLILQCIDLAYAARKAPLDTLKKVALEKADTIGRLLPPIDPSEQSVQLSPEQLRKMN